MNTDTEAQSPADQVLDAALMHVPFDGWTETTLRAAIADSGVDNALARSLYPRGGVDLALAYHRRGDAMMRDRLAQTDLVALRYRDRIATAIRFRLEAIEDKEAVRRGATLFALPNYSADGARAVWGTADAIWSALGDSSRDINWYTKRASLSAVYSATVLFWLGDDSLNHQATWDFLDRRIEGVMQFEKAKARFQDNPLAKLLLAGPKKLMEKVQKPMAPDDLPGRW
ncbi:MAG: COQ9 family protein [Rhodobacteraceae bacterium]|nr:COQ9 family protein [Paracoccaceae bacterium]